MSRLTIGKTLVRHTGYKPPRIVISRTSVEDANIAKFVEELVANTPDQRNWRAILIALIVIGMVIGLVLGSVVLLSPPDRGPPFTGERFQLNHIIGGTLKAPKFEAHWISSTEIAYRDDDNGVSVLDSNSLNVTKLLSHLTFRLHTVHEFRVSPDKNYILLRHDGGGTKADSHVVEAEYTAMEAVTEQIEAITPFPQRDEPTELQHVMWVPGTTGIVMMHSNDIYYKESPTSSKVRRITSSGEKNMHIYNGVTDYLYYKYILKTREAVWISSDGSHLCFAQFNDSEVADVPILTYSDPKKRFFNLKYPMVDTPNPQVTLFVVELNGGNTSNPPIKLNPPIKIREMDHYITDVQWTTDSSVSVVYRNRNQNISLTSLCYPPDWQCDEITSEESDKKRWVIVEKTPIFEHNSTMYVTISPLLDGETGSYPHIHQGVRSYKHKTPLTIGPYSVFKVLAWDMRKHYVYYEANREGEPAEHHLWRVTDMQAAEPRLQECLTCSLNSSSKPCRHYTPIFSNGNFDTVMLYCEGPSVPHTILYSLSDEEEVFLVQNNTDLLALNEEMAWPQQRDFRVELDSGFLATVRLHIPPEIIDEKSVLPTTTIIHVSSVTGEQIVNHKWGADLNTYLVSNRSWAVVQMDVRGAGGQELTEYYQPAWSLGTAEVQDYLAIIKYISETVSLVDVDRLGAWGWGAHQGHNTLRLLGEDHDKMLKCVATVGPITDWKSYASFYTEKYMGSAVVTEGSNYKGYEETSLLLKGDLYRNRTLFLAHGSANLDAHNAHTRRFTKELSKNGVLFKQQTYTDEDEDLSNVREHLLKTIDRFFFECFPPFTEKELDELLENSK